MSSFDPPGYGAVPPSSPPPPGPPPGFPPPAGPPGFPPPGGPGGPTGSGGSRKGLWITLAVVGVVLLVGLGVALVLLLTGDDGDDGRGDDRDGASSSTTSGTGAEGDPVEVLEALLDDAAAGDCEAALAHLTPDAQEADPCSSEEFQLLASGGVEAEVGDAVVDGDTATVPVEFTESAVTQDYSFTLVAVDGEWLVDDWEPGPPTYPSTDATDATDGPGSTDDPTGSTGSPGAPGGDSTAASVPNDPVSVAEALYESTLSGDCATANDLITEEFKAREGECEPSDLDSSGIDPDDFSIEADDPVYNGARDEATVAVDLVYLGTSVPATFTLAKVDGRWLVDAVDGDM